MELIDSPIISSTAPQNSPLVYFDLETTGLSVKYSEICQIAARYEDQEFSAYMIPTRPISKNAADVTGLSVCAGEMFLHGEKVETIPFHVALQNFLQFLSNIGKDITLVAHNGFRFDARILIKYIRVYNLWEKFTSVVYGFTDTLLVLRAKLPSRTAAKLKFTQVDLASDLLGENVAADAHNALNDVRILQRIVDKAEVTRQELIDRSKSVTAMIQIIQKSALKNANKITMDCMKGSVSDGMIDKMAEAGITLDLLQRAYKEGNKGIELLLSEDIGGRPRITKNKKILRNVFSEVKKTLESTQNTESNT
ncbi:DNA polymerase III PolC-type-like isoform X1 [Anoplolepis gracilipes]|uniref:DNA polymerase III PolC-type-like isoform X1 n=1 Tax=Anoplolepis gracilipes TaxID=354296 RepID=UPI003B9E7355